MFQCVVNFHTLKIIKLTLTKIINVEVTEVDDPQQPDKKKQTFFVSKHFVQFWSLSIYDFEPEKIKCNQILFSTIKMGLNQSTNRNL